MPREGEGAPLTMEVDREGFVPLRLIQSIITVVFETLAFAGFSGVAENKGAA